MILVHGGLKISGGLIFRVFLALRPCHEKAVAQSAEHAHGPEAGRFADAATVVVVGDVQALVHRFDSPVASVELEPFLGREFVGLRAGDQADLFVLAAGALAQQAGGLGRQREEGLFGRDESGAEGATFVAALVFFQRAALGGRGLLRGENPLGER